ncbi:FAD-binding oxidoreductase [Streptomyces sp. PKU-EA00015]|uniref:NAD(P)/FAD-dependent oxidoreductase n=1 Tax=Streptomyces sp. PKU-EA00015 TaxID=2748326 RepID=UPI0015A4863D|nr:FAD-binding oxidoreductase [Streptomyces sp. PKU-EA00015]NWF30072.1 FAD-binding oxidoreductase [Streptomyces sp. PKU-EA00015]
MPRVLVVGAGVLGASVAHHLVQAGAHVTVIDAGGPAAGTSSATFSIDVTHLKTPFSYYALNRRGAELHQRLGEELGGADWRHPAPLVQWGHTEQEQHVIRERAERLRGWGHACRSAHPAELADLAPGVSPDACRADELVVHEHACWYDAPLFTRRLLDRAALGGADIRFGLRVTEVLRTGERITGVVAEGRRFDADWVVNCAGPDAGRIAALAGASLPLNRVPGLVGESTRLPEHDQLGAILATPGVDLRPAPDGRVVSISWPVDALLPPDAEGAADTEGAADAARQADPALEQELHRLGREVFTPLRAAGMAGVRLGVRPVPADGLPLVGCAEATPGLYTVVTHSGVTLAPALGLLAAREIVGGRACEELADYRPDRTPATDVLDESVQVMSGAAAITAA